MIIRSSAFATKCRPVFLAAFFVMQLSLIILSLLLLSACDNDASRLETVNDYLLEGNTMGTYYRVSVVADAEQVLPSQQHLQKQLEMSLAESSASFSTYIDDSEVSRFNQLAVGECLALSDDFFALLELSRKVNEDSNGRFNPAVGPLVELWGFGSRDVQLIPSASEIAALLSQTDLSRAFVHKSDNANDHKFIELCKRDPIELDFSAVAKGFAVDALAALLNDLGIVNYLIDIGGELSASGVNKRRELWRVAIEQPSTDAIASPAVERVVNLNGEAIATSGNYRNFFEHDGVRYAHTLDPQTGRPVEHSILSASVIDQSAAIADAWATALMAAGTDRAKNLIAEHELEALLLVSSDYFHKEADDYHQQGVVEAGQGDYTVWYSKGFKSRLQNP